MHALHEIEKIDLEKLLERRRQRVLAFGVLKKHGFFSAVSEFFLRAPRQNHRTAKAKVIEAANLRDSLEMAYLQSRNIDLSKPHVHCEKEDGRGCGSFIPLEEYLDNFKSCPTCGKGEPLSPYEWVDILCDGNSFRESNANLTARDLIRDEDLRTDYTSLLEKMEKKSGSGEALVTGVGSINGYECVLMISDFNFIGGSMGSAMGEKIARAVQYCLEERLPLISVCSSGGARMHEGTISLMQMAKTNMAIAMLKEDHLPYISLLAHPCTGGALASYATQGTINLSEENALIAFAGPRVTELAGIKVDPEFINSAFVLRKGGIDEIVPRSRLRQVITRYLKFYAQTH
jgi:acetyl-CoA carboxylase carboxyl transferase beta subunit